MIYDRHMGGDPARGDPAARAIIELLRSGAPVRFVARGPSMWPAVPDGSLVEVEPVPASNLMPGDLAAFERSGSVVVHRVLWSHGGTLRCAGDALARADVAVPHTDVLGRASVISARPIAVRWPSLQHVVLLARAYARRAHGLATHICRRLTRRTRQS